MFIEVDKKEKKESRIDFIVSKLLKIDVEEDFPKNHHKEEELLLKKNSFFFMSRKNKRSKFQRKTLCDVDRFKEEENRQFIGC